MEESKIKIEIDDSEVREKFLKLQELGISLSHKMMDVGLKVQNTIELAFEEQQSPYGETWEPLADSTVSGSYRGRKKGKRGKETAGYKAYASGRKILIQEGTLAGAFQPEISGDTVTLGTNLPYAAIHHFGGDAGRGKQVKIPARPYLPFKDDQLHPDLQDDIVSYLTNVIKRSID